MVRPALLVAFVFFSCLPLSHPQDVLQCLQCTAVPAQCNFSLIEEPSRTGEINLNATCVPDTEECNTTPCGDDVHDRFLCTYDYTLNRKPGEGNAITPAIFMQSMTTTYDLMFSSGCFNEKRPCLDKCDVSHDDMGGTFELMISCCCNETGATCPDAVRSVVVANVSLRDTAPIPSNPTEVTEVTSYPPTSSSSTSFSSSSSSSPSSSPSSSSSSSSSSSTVSIWVGIIGAMLALIIVAAIAVAVVMCCKRHRCVRRRHKTSQTSITRQYSRYSQPWVLQGLIGQGRFGQVYKALYNGEVVAVKVYSGHSRTTWENERNLFSLESTRHANIMEFVTSESNESGGMVATSPLQLYLVTRYYPLGTLEGYLRANVLSWKQACCVVWSIANGLKHLHSESCTECAGIKTEKYAIAHRDIKSSNVLIRDETGDCVIADLGLALQLVPTDNASDLSNHGQAGTIRYMSPEALEARVNLLDLQSFKQIDIYAFSLVMWEVMSRCCVLTTEDIGDYALPYADLVTHPTLEGMKDIVCTRQLRPLIPSLWSNHEPLSTYAKMMQECWEGYPEARLTAGNILHQMEDLCNSSPQIQQDQMTQSHASSTSQNHAPSNQQPHLPTDIGHVLFQEHSQSSPPPCYSPTDPVPFSAAQNQENISRMRGVPGRGHFRTSMPHIMPTATEDGRSADLADVATLTPGCTRSLRSSGVQQSGWSQYHPPLSVRNSLVLGGARTQVIDDPLPSFSDVCAEDLSSVSSTHSLGVGAVPAMCNSSSTSSVIELETPQNADSGIHSNHSCASRSTVQSEGSTPPPADVVDTRGFSEITRDTAVDHSPPSDHLAKETTV